MTLGTISISKSTCCAHTCPHVYCPPKDIQKSILNRQELNFYTRHNLESSLFTTKCDQLCRLTRPQTKSLRYH